MVPFALLSRHLIREVYAASGDSAGIRGGATDGVGELGSVVVQPLASSIGITISPARLPLGTHSRAAVLVGTPECCEQQVRQRRRQTWLDLPAHGFEEAGHGQEQRGNSEGQRAKEQALLDRIGAEKHSLIVSKALADALRCWASATTSRNGRRRRRRS
ncbi:hypothetical protein D3C77_255060 [compost metagenome]